MPVFSSKFAVAPGDSWRPPIGSNSTTPGARWEANGSSPNVSTD